MNITIFKRGTIIVRETIDPEQSDQQSISLLGEDTITLTYKTTDPAFFGIGDYCFFFNKQYVINSQPEYTVDSKRNITYTIILESQMYELGKSDFLFLNSVNNFEQPVFTFRGTPKDYGDLLIYNLRRDFPQTGWNLGSVIEGDFITQSFTSTNCLDALKTIANIFQTEYLVEGNIINIYKRQISSGITLKIGIEEALLTLNQKNQTNANLITRLRAFGSTKNITTAYRNGSGVLRMKGGDTIEKNISIYGLFSKTILFDGTTTDVKTNSPLPEIYPHRLGTITGVETISSPSPVTPTTYFLYFTDSDIDFNVNDYLISGESAIVTFNSGLLVGYNFNIDSFDNTLKRFKLIINQDNSSLIVPTDDLKPYIGDKYVITNIEQPQVYIDKAESDLKIAAQNYIDTYSIPPLVFAVTCNSFYFQQRNITILLANVVGLINDDLKINRSYRVINITRNLFNTNLYSLQLADTANQNSILVTILNGL